MSLSCLELESVPRVGYPTSGNYYIQLMWEYKNQLKFFVCPSLSIKRRLYTESISKLHTNNSK